MTSLQALTTKAIMAFKTNLILCLKEEISFLKIYFVNLDIKNYKTNYFTWLEDRH